MHSKATVKHLGTGDLTDSPSETLSQNTRWTAAEVQRQRLSAGMKGLEPAYPREHACTGADWGPLPSGIRSHLGHDEMVVT